MTAGLVVLWFWAPEDVTRTATFLPLLCWNRAAACVLGSPPVLRGPGARSASSASSALGLAGAPVSAAWASAILLKPQD